MILLLTTKICLRLIYSNKLCNYAQTLTGWAQLQLKQGSCLVGLNSGEVFWVRK